MEKKEKPEKKEEAERKEKTADQQLAQAEARVTRLKKEMREQETGQKIILGGLLLQQAKHQPKMAKWILDKAAEHVTRPTDQRRLKPLLDGLRKSLQTDTAHTGTVVSESPAL